MQLRHLQAFVASVQRRSFTRAAAALDLTQAAVSQHVAALEQEFGVELFRREARGVSLTDEGRLLHGYAQKILALVDEVDEKLRQTPGQVTGDLLIASSTVPSEWLLPELLVAFRARWPAIRETVSVSDSKLTRLSVEAGDADIGFVGEVPKSSVLETVEVAADELILFVGPSHPFAKTGSATLKQLRDESLIIREAGSASRHCVEDALDKAGVSADEMTIAMEANNNEMIRAAVQRGLGVAFLSKRASTSNGGLVPVKVRGLHPRRQLYLIKHMHRVPLPPAQQFLKFVEAWRAENLAGPR